MLKLSEIIQKNSYAHWINAEEDIIGLDISDKHDIDL